MSLVFEKCYFMDEVRDGFLVPGLTKKALAVCLNNYDSLIKTCNTAGIKPFFAFGSLIGAVRYNGFIPWDDDIDIEMIRDDYLVLSKCAKDEQIPSDHTLISYAQSDYLSLVRLWMDGEATVRKRELWNEYYGFPITTSVDIFLLDHIPDDDKDREMFKKKLYYTWKLASDAWMIKSDSKCDIDRKEFDDRIKQLEMVNNCDLHSCHPKLLMIHILNQYDKICEETINTGSKTLAGTNMLLNNEWFRMPQKLYSDVIELPFENGTVLAPIGYEIILQKIYGNYMKPILAGATHTYPYYGGVEKKLKQLYGVELLHYHYDLNKVLQVLDEKQERIPLKERIKEYIDVITELHRVVCSTVSLGEGVEMIPELLGQCQELALKIGDFLEKKAVNGDNYIELLEKYCESVFCVFKGITEGEGFFDVGMCEAEKTLQLLVDNGICNVNEKKELLFVSYRVEHWKSLHSLWEEVSKFPDTEVTVISVPYYYKDSEGSILKDDMQYETEGYPEEVELTSFESYNIEACHPDVIITTCPYDAYHVGMSIHPLYYTSNLRKHTEQLVLMPPFVLREVMPSDGCSRHSLRLFLHNPGTVYADKIIAQSERMRDVFIEILDEMDVTDADDSRISHYLDWNRKVIGVGHPIWDSDSDEEQIKTEPEGERVIVYSITGSMLFGFGKKAIDKAREVIKIVKGNPGVKLLWYTDPYAEKILHKRERETWRAYRELVDELKNDPNVAVEDTFDEDKTLETCDLIYGNGSVLMNRVRQMGKPALLENPWVSVCEPEGYEKKEWVDGIDVAYEGEWSLENFIYAGMRYQKPRHAKGNAERILNSILDYDPRDL